MEVILQEDYPSLGFVGDKVEVKPGYARNFLVPRGIAVEASSRDARSVRHRLSVIAAKKVKKKTEADELRKKIEALSLSFTLKGGSSGKGFGSITAKDIEESLLKLGLQIDKRLIKLSESFKAAGEYRVSVKLHGEVQAQLPVVIVVE